MATTYSTTGTTYSGRPQRRRMRGRRAWWAASLGVLLVAGALSGMAVATAPNAPTGGDRAHRAASFIEAQIESDRLPAASYAVIDNGRAAASGAVGHGVTPDTPFMVGSLSKSFTALAIMQQVDQGTIALDDPVTRHIPWFRTAGPAAVITVRQLLNQTSGLPTSAGTADLNSPELTLEQRVRAVRNVRLAGTPGETFRYCNKNYATLGLILERVTGQSYADYVREHVFAPLQMDNSYTDQDAAERAGLAKGSASWFGANIGRDTEAYPGALPDGYLISTAEDMTHFLRAQLDGTFRGKRIVSQRAIDQMHSPTVSAQLYPRRNHYGFGWATGTVHGRAVVSHAGELQNYYAELALLPGQRDGVLMLTARHALLGDNAAPANGALDILTGGESPGISRGFTVTNICVGAMALVLLALLGAATARLVRTLRGLGARIGTVGGTRAVLRPGLGYLAASALTYLAVFLSLGAAMGSGGIMPLATALGYAPDITAMVLAVVGFLAVRGLAVLIAGSVIQRRLTH